jgi:hypothetical protein
MFCKNCGRQLDEGESYCPICGTVNSPEAAATGYSVPVMDDSVKDRMAGEVLKWGILSLAFAISCLSLLGFIFSFTAKRKSAEFLNYFGVLEGRARVGHILGRVGFGVGLGYTIFFVIYFAIIIFAMVLSIGGLM